MWWAFYFRIYPRKFQVLFWICCISAANFRYRHNLLLPREKVVTVFHSFARRISSCDTSLFAAARCFLFLRCLFLLGALCYLRKFSTFYANEEHCVVCIIFQRFAPRLFPLYGSQRTDAFSYCGCLTLLQQSRIAFCSKSSLFVFPKPVRHDIVTTTQCSTASLSSRRRKER